MNPCFRERGSALIEFSLLIMSLMLITLGVFNFGLAIQQGMSVSAAAHAGAVYGATEGNYQNTSGMQTAALAAAKGISSTVTATATSWCTCTDGSTTAVACNSLCNTYNPPFAYVTVTTSATIPLLFRFANLPLTIPLSGSSTLRVR